jgi:hypothetical protein
MFPLASSVVSSETHQLQKAPDNDRVLIPLRRDLGETSSTFLVPANRWLTRAIGHGRGLLGSFKDNDRSFGGLRDDLTKANSPGIARGQPRTESVERSREN